jgi:hypothetical protein
MIIAAFIFIAAGVITMTVQCVLWSYEDINHFKTYKR